MKPILLGCVRRDVWRTSSLANSTKGPFSSQSSTLGATITISWSIKRKVETINFHWWPTQVLRAQNPHKEVQKSWIISQKQFLSIILPHRLLIYTLHTLRLLGMTPASHRSIESKLIWSITLSTIVSSTLPGKTCCYEASVPVWMLRSCRLDLLWRQSQVVIISGLCRWPIFCWRYPSVRSCWSHLENDNNYDVNHDQRPDHDDTQLCGDSGAMSYSWRAPSSWGEGKPG